MSFGSNITALRGRVGELRPLLFALAARHRFWLESAGITALALLVLVAFGILAMRRSAAWEGQIGALRGVEVGMVTAISNFQPADSEEGDYWGESATALTGLTVQPSDPLTVAGVIAQRSEEVGVGSLRVRLDEESGIGALGPIQVSEWRAVPEPTLIVAEFPGGPGVLAQFVGILPPHVEVLSVALNATAGIRRNEVRLLVRSVEGPR